MEFLEILEIYWNLKSLLEILEFNCSSRKFMCNRSMIDNGQEWHPVIKFSCSPVIGNGLA